MLFRSRLHLGRRAAWIAGVLSGFFGGLVGNQGGIRSAALLSFDMQKEAIVATATAVALIVDGARMPVYSRLKPPASCMPGALSWSPSLESCWALCMA